MPQSLVWVNQRSTLRLTAQTKLSSTELVTAYLLVVHARLLHSLLLHWFPFSFPFILCTYNIIICFSCLTELLAFAAGFKKIIFCLLCSEKSSKKKREKRPSPNFRVYGNCFLCPKKNLKWNEMKLKLKLRNWQNCSCNRTRAKRTWVCFLWPTVVEFEFNFPPTCFSFSSFRHTHFSIVSTACLSSLPRKRLQLAQLSIHPSICVYT